MRSYIFRHCLIFFKNRGSKSSFHTAVQNAKHPIYFRAFSSSSNSAASDSLTAEEKPGWENEEVSTEKVKINFVTKHGVKHEVEGHVGENIMKVAIRYGIGEGGCCEGKLCCTTCHVYAEEKLLEKIPPSSFKEEDVLDGAPFLKDNSRLSCQITVTKDIEGSTFTLPFGTINMNVDKP